MAGEYRLRVLTTDLADERYVLREEVEDTTDTASPVLISPTAPTSPLVVPGDTYLWIDTSVAGKFTFWIEDGI